MRLSKCFYLLLLSIMVTACGGDGGKTNPVSANLDTGSNQPIVDAGPDQTVKEKTGNSATEVTLTGAYDASGLGTIIWSQVAGIEVKLEYADETDSTTATFTVPNIDTVETLTFELEVIDDKGSRNSDRVSINVEPIEPREDIKVVATPGMAGIGFSEDHVFIEVSEAITGRGGHITFAGAVGKDELDHVNGGISALWGGQPDNISLIEKEGDQVSNGLSNLVFESFIPLSVSSDGKILYQAKLRNAAQDLVYLALMYFDGINSHIIFKNGDTPEGFEDGTYFSELHPDEAIIAKSGVAFVASLGVSDDKYAAHSLWFYDFDGLNLKALRVRNQNISSAPFDDIVQETLDVDRISYACTEIELLGFNDQADILLKTSEYSALMGNTKCDYSSSSFSLIRTTTSGSELILSQRQPISGTEPNIYYHQLNKAVLLSDGNVAIDSKVNPDQSFDYLHVNTLNGDLESIALTGELLSNGVGELEKLRLLTTSSHSDNEFLAYNFSENQGFTLLKGKTRSETYSDLTEPEVSELETILQPGDDVPSDALGRQVQFQFLDPLHSPTMNLNGEIIFSASADDGNNAEMTEQGLWHINSNGNFSQLMTFWTSTLPDYISIAGEEEMINPRQIDFSDNGWVIVTSSFGRHKTILAMQP